MYGRCHAAHGLQGLQKKAFSQDVRLSCVMQLWVVGCIASGRRTIHLILDTSFQNFEYCVIACLFCRFLAVGTDTYY
jgi:hypothetical protein